MIEPEHLEKEAYDIVTQILDQPRVINIDHPPVLHSPDSYDDLKKLILSKYLCQEIEALKTMTRSSSAEFKEKFLKRWQEMIEETKNTCLDFNAHAKNVSELYWSVALALFKPATLGEMLSLLFPEAQVLHFEEQADASFGFKNHSLISLSQAPTFENLRELIVLDGVIFDLRCITHLNLDQHRALYEAAQQTYPNLVAKLYRWNDPLKMVFRDLLLIREEIPTPRQMLQILIQKLRMGRSEITEGGLARMEAHIACNEFSEYLASFSPGFRAELLGMEAFRFSHGETLGLWLNKLPNEDVCVSSLAHYLQMILENPENNAVLGKTYTISEKELERLDKQYQTCILSICGDDNIDCLPKNKVQEQLTKIRVKTPYEYLKLFQNIHTNFYSQVIKQIPTRKFSLLLDLLSVLDSGFLNQEQLAALQLSIIENHKKLGGVLRIAVHAARDQNYQLFIICLPNLNKPQQISVFKMKFNDRTFLHRLVGDSQRLLSLLALLPQDFPLLKILNDERNSHKTILYFALKCSVSLRALLERIPLVDRPQAFIDHGEILGAAASDYPESFDVIMELLPQESRAALLMLTGCLGQPISNAPVLYRAASQLSSLKTILKFLNQEEIRSIIDKLEEEKPYDTILNSALYNPECLRVLIALYPEEVRRMVKRKSPLFCLNPKSTEALQMILELYHPSERLAALEEKPHFGRKPIDNFCEEPKAMLIILQMLPEEERIRALQKSKRLLLSLSYNPKDLQTLLKLIPKEYRLTEMQKNEAGYQTFLSTLWGNYDALKHTVCSLSENEKLWKAYETLASYIMRRSWDPYSMRPELSKLQIKQLKCIADHGRIPEVIVKPKDHQFFNPSSWLSEIDQWQLTAEELSILSVVFLGVHGVEYRHSAEKLDLKLMSITVTMK